MKMCFLQKSSACFQVFKIVKCFVFTGLFGPFMFQLTRFVCNFLERVIVGINTIHQGEEAAATVPVGWDRVGRGGQRHNYKEHKRKRKKNKNNKVKKQI